MNSPRQDNAHCPWLSACPSILSCCKLSALPHSAVQVSFDSAAADSQVITDRSGGMIAKYYKVDAALVDMSMRGKTVQGDKDNTAAEPGRLVC
jgi:hypothetical protein